MPVKRPSVTNFTAEVGLDAGGLEELGRFERLDRSGLAMEGEELRAA